MIVAGVAVTASATVTRPELDQVTDADLAPITDDVLSLDVPRRRAVPDTDIAADLEVNIRIAWTTTPGGACAVSLWSPNGAHHAANLELTLDDALTFSMKQIQALVQPPVDGGGG